MPENGMPSPPEEDRIKRPASVTTAGVVLLVGSALVAFVALSTLFLSYRIRPPSVLSQSDDLRRALGILSHLAVSAWGIATAVGVFRLRSWARVSVLVLSLMAAHFFFGAVLGGSLLSGPTGADNAWMAWIMRSTTLTFFGCGSVAALGVIHFSGKRMDHLFQAPATPPLLPQSPADAPPTGATPPTLVGAAPPLSFVVIAMWLFAVWPLALLSMLRHVRTGLPFPMFPLGANLHGMTATAYYLAITLVGAALGTGLMRLKEWARVGAIALCVFTILSLLAPALRPGAFAEVVAYLNYTADVSISRSSFWLITLWNAAPPAAAIWFLHARRQNTSGAAS